ncbi:MAG: tyrosine-protein phosphatase [Ruminococcaceae bacterium]|nr:tyrosine-protein phosphatase [Oscillospiraceae bacterium]
MTGNEHNNMKPEENIKITMDDTQNGEIRLINTASESDSPADSHSSGSSSHHHSGHSHHHHHHSSSSKKRKRNNNKKNKNKEKFKEFVAKNKKILAYAAITLVLFVGLIYLGSHLDNRGSDASNNPGDSQNPDVEIASNELQIKVPLLFDSVSTVTPVVEEFMKLEEGADIHAFCKKYQNANTRLDVGLPVELYYDLSGVPQGQAVKTSEFIVSEYADYSSPYVVKTTGSNAKAEIYNLKSATKYYYCINLTFTNGSTTSVSGSFNTASGPRVLLVDGVRNIRDIGGWKTANGTVIKQGLLYRGREIDGLVEPEYLITSAGVSTMLTQLGIKTDMDLRPSAENPYGIDVLGPGVNHIYYAAPMYANIFNGDENREKIRQIFSDLADESNYPIYLHCTYGQDRTGTVCYLLEALLGLDSASLEKEYNMSALCYGNVSTQQFNEFVSLIKAQPGYTLAEKVERYLVSIGVTYEEIEAIRNIFLEN